MEYIKDNKKTSQLSSFIESQNIRTNPFGENKVGDRAYRRAERIAAGIYLLTNHIPQSEPLRAAVRHNSIHLVDGILRARNEIRAPDSLSMQEIKTIIRGTISHVRLLALAGYISTQNTEAVTEALDELGHFLDVSQRSPFAEHISISRDELLDVRDTHVTSALHVKDKRPIKDTSTVSDKVYSSDTVLYTKPVSDMSQNTPTVISPHSMQRREMILDSLRSYAVSHGVSNGMGSSMSIRDIAIALPEYSEKMIQRELADLIQQNMVKKTGTKRWSRYSLVN